MGFTELTVCSVFGTFSRIKHVPCGRAAPFAVRRVSHENTSFDPGNSANGKSNCTFTCSTGQSFFITRNTERYSAGGGWRSGTGAPTPAATTEPEYWNGWGALVASGGVTRQVTGEKR